MERRRGQLANGQDPAILQGGSFCYGTHGSEGSHTESLRWQDLPDRYWYAEQLLPGGQGVGVRNPEYWHFHGEIYGPTGGAAGSCQGSTVTGSSDELERTGSAEWIFKDIFFLCPQHRLARAG